MSVAANFSHLIPPAEMDRSAFKAFADRLIATSSDLVGENLDAKVSAALPLNTNEVGVEPFGADVDTVRISVAILAYLYRWWFRVEVSGIENLPESGSVLVVGNHSGQLPLDGVMIAMAMVLDAPKPRFARAMVERFIQTLPFFSVWFPRVGQVLGTPENAQRLLESGEALVVFPEGVKGIAKSFDRRYKLAPFGQGFLRLALQTRTPILPVAVIGAEEQYPTVANLEGLGKILGLPALPIIPQLFLGMLAPLPTKYRLHFGELMHFSGDPDDDDAVIDEKVWRVRATIQSMVNRGLKERKAIFW